MSKNRKLRTTKLSFGDDDDDKGGTGTSGAGAAADVPPPPPPPPLGKQSKKSGKTLLSFGDDEEMAFQPSNKPTKQNGGGSSSTKDKSAKAKFRAKLPEPATSAAPEQGQSAGAGEYTAEKLRELQKNTLKIPSAMLTASLQEAAAASASADGGGAAAAGAGAGGIIRLAGSFKQAKAKDDRFTISAAQLTTTDPAGDEEMPLPPPKGRPPAGPGAGRPRPGAARGAAGPGAGSGGAALAAGGGAEGDGDEEGDDFFVPDERTIRRAKEKRERLRQAHLAPDYIPLGGASRLLASAGAAGGGRGARGGGGNDSGGSDGDDGGGGAAACDEGGSGSDDEAEALQDRMRVAFIGNKQQQQQGGRRGEGAYATTVADGEEDEAFAAEQLRKAIRKNRGAEAGTGAAAGDAAGAPGAGAAAAAAPYGSGGAGGGAAGRARLAALAAAGRAAVQAVGEALARARLGQKQAGSNLERTAGHLANALESIEKCRSDIRVAGEKYSAVQQLKSYCSDLCECLAAKAALCEELEDHMRQMREERGEKERAVRTADDAVLLAQGEAAVAAAVAALSQGASASGAAAAANGGGEESDPEVDEFGRTVALEHRKDIEEGSARRRKLVEAASRQLRSMEAGGRLDLEERLPGEEDWGGGDASYSSRRHEVLDAAATVFGDAADEYATLDAVKGRLEAFKASHPGDYGSAYIGDSAPALFAPFVRLELLKWDPLYGGDAGFDGHRWYRSLFDYGIAPGADPPAAPEDDPDANLVPQIVENLVLPQAVDMVQRCWDPTDPQQSRAVAAIAADLFVYVPADREGMGELLGALAAALEGAAASCAAPAWPASAVAAAPVAEAVLHLRFRRAARLLRGLGAFKELLSQDLLQRLALQQLAQRCMLPQLRAAAVAAGAPRSGGGGAGMALAVGRAEAAVQPLPPQWFREGAPAEARPLVELLQSLARALEAQRGEHAAAQQQRQQQQGGGGVGGGADRADLARRLGVLLSHVGLRQRGETLAAAFGARL